jgi:hypothetical protein
MEYRRLILEVKNVSGPLRFVAVYQLRFLSSRLLNTCGTAQALENDVELVAALQVPCGPFFETILFFLPQLFSRGKVFSAHRSLLLLSTQKRQNELLNASSIRLL